MRGSRREQLRCDQLFSRPDTGERIQPVGQCLPEYNDVRGDPQVLHRPEFSRTIKSHLDLIIDDQNIALAARLLKASEIFPRGNHVPSGPLDGFDVERAVLRCLRLSVPDRMVFCVKQPGELVLAVHVAGLALQAINAAEAIGIKDELGAISEVPVAPPVSVAGSDG